MIQTWKEVSFHIIMNDGFQLLTIYREVMVVDGRNGRNKFISDVDVLGSYIRRWWLDCISSIYVVLCMDTVLSGRTSNIYVYYPDR